MRLYLRSTGLTSLFSLIHVRPGSGPHVVATLEYDPLRSWLAPASYGMVNWQTFRALSLLRPYCLALADHSSFAYLGSDRVRLGDLADWEVQPDYLRVLRGFSATAVGQLDQFLAAGCLDLRPFDAVLDSSLDRLTLAVLLEETLCYRAEEIMRGVSSEGVRDGGIGG